MGGIRKFHPSFDRRHLACIRLVGHGNFLIQDAENPFRACNRVLDVGPQHGDLLDGLVEALDVGQEGDDEAEGDGRAEESLVPKQGPAAHTDHDGQRNVRQGFERGRQGGGERHGAHVGIPVGSVDFLELLDVLVGAVEGLHFTDGGDAFLQLGVDVADLLAAGTEGLARLRREVERGDEHDRRDRE